MATICYNYDQDDDSKGVFTMNKKLLIVLVAALFTMCTVYHVEAADKTPEQMVKESKAVIKEVSIDDVKKMIDTKENAIILDVTDKHEFEGGHLPGAINISRGTLEFKVAQIIPDKNSRIVVCQNNPLIQVTIIQPPCRKKRPLHISSCPKKNGTKRSVTSKTVSMTIPDPVKYYKP